MSNMSSMSDRGRLNSWWSKMRNVSNVTSMNSVKYLSEVRNVIFANMSDVSNSILGLIGSNNKQHKYF